MKSLPIVIERRSPSHRAFQVLGAVSRMSAFYLYAVERGRRTSVLSAGLLRSRCRSASSD